MFVRTSDFGWVVHAPAKINLALEVLGRQHDGYHQVETLLVPVRRFDTVAFYNNDTPLTLQISTTFPTSGSETIPSGASNLAYQAVERLAQRSGRPATGHLRLVKRIPVKAGLGGGSADAAAALVAANGVWQLGYSRSQLAAVAAELGTDVPFFLFPGAALATGRGEQISPVSIPAGIPVVIAQPPEGLATPQVFAQLGLRPGEQSVDTNGICRQLIRSLSRGLPVASWRHLMHNRLQPAAERLCHSIARLASTMARLPVLAHQMTGSGSAYFGVCRTWREARGIASRLREQPWQHVFATCTCQ